jgi:hypothetical protein
LHWLCPVIKILFKHLSQKVLVFWIILYLITQFLKIFKFHPSHKHKINIQIILTLSQAADFVDTEYPMGDLSWEDILLSQAGEFGMTFKNRRTFVILLNCMNSHWTNRNQDGKVWVYNTYITVFTTRFIPNYGTNVLKVEIFLFEIYFKIDNIDGRNIQYTNIF